MAVIQLKDVAHRYGDRAVLSRINLEVEQGEFVSIVGSSACGKTTLLKLACGLLQPSSGSATVNGSALSEFCPGGAIVFQNYSLLPWLSALENVRLAVAAAFPKMTTKQQTEHCEKYLSLVGLGAAGAKKPSQLSGGMRQRVAIARAFAVEPKVLFLDEPFGALDALTRATLQQELVRLCSGLSEPITTLMITNSVDEAILLSDRIHALGRGPSATLSEAFPVNLPRPRSAETTMNEAEAVQLRADIADTLTGHRSSAPSAALTALNPSTVVAGA
jgi:nitrate/nitrite transport system ATP-binding protein